MRRRALISGLGGAAIAWPFCAFSQKPIRVIGLLSPFTPAETEPGHEALGRGRRHFAGAEGDNTNSDSRSSEGHAARLPEVVADLLSLKPDGVVAAVNPAPPPAARATKTIPIVMAAPGDPVATGLIKSLA